ncbi:YfiR family protein [Massilia sp. Dwa41.01b]|uniref:YfiR family protein n=1 Tax=unclassified Massilia TaxID=2609279 RepID=UPI001603567F|nr:MULTISPECIES: YfiR family protein [unclassified Massilia]QNA90540.1 YfiR family protein [Massilia sp. Dwa41.01b]QNA97773.1 YfiR family protein [Massilia sp. Se16.2.3]
MLPRKAGAVVMAFAVRAAHPARWLLLVLWLLAGCAAAQPARVESALKAAYLVKFAGFVDWPGTAFARADSPLVIGVAGNEELAQQLEQMVAGRKVGSHPLTVRRLRRGDSPAGLQVLYVGNLERAASAELLDAARGLPLLTVSDAPEAPAGMIHFVLMGDRLRFEVALREVAPSGLKISARMLAAAWRITGTT